MIEEFAKQLASSNADQLDNIVRQALLLWGVREPFSNTMMASLSAVRAPDSTHCFYGANLFAIIYKPEFVTSEGYTSKSSKIITSFRVFGPDGEIHNGNDARGGLDEKIHS